MNQLFRDQHTKTHEQTSIRFCDRRYTQIQTIKIGQRPYNPALCTCAAAAAIWQSDGATRFALHSESASMTAATARWRAGVPARAAAAAAGFLELGRRFAGRVRLAVGDDRLALGRLLPNFGAPVLEPDLQK